MILCIDAVLARAKQREILAAIREAEFVDGKETAGFRAKLVKNNLQMKKSAPNAEDIKGSVVEALRGSSEFQPACVMGICLAFAAEDHSHTVLPCGSTS